MDSENGAITQITVESDNLSKQAANLMMSAKSNEATVTRLRQELAAAQKDGTSAEKIAALENNLKAAQTKVSANKVAVHFDNMLKDLMNC